MRSTTLALLLVLASGALALAAPLAEAGATPRGLLCLATFDGNRVTWGTSSFAQTYRLYRKVGDEKANETLVYEGTDQSFIDLALVAGDPYRYELAAARDGVETPRASCDVVAVPFFGGAWSLAGSVAGALLAFAALRR